VKKLSNLIDRFCFNHPRFGIPNLTLVLITGSVAVYILDMLTYSTVGISSLLSFNRALILQGQVWRLVTFVFTTWGQSLFSFLLAMYFLWFLGTTLEREWGTAKFTCYYGLGLLLTILIGMFTGYASTSYLETTLFLAFATLYPDTQLLLFFFIPIKMKYMAWISGAMLALSFLGSLIRLDVGGALLVLVSVLNYLIFFWEDLMYQSGRIRGRAKHSQKSNVIQFKKAAKDFQKREYTHKCAVCGRTDVDFPDLDFRYCSRCAGYHCYCMDHINNHAHITE